MNACIIFWVDKICSKATSLSICLFSLYTMAVPAVKNNHNKKSWLVKKPIPNVLSIHSDQWKNTEYCLNAYLNYPTDMHFCYHLCSVKKHQQSIKSKCHILERRIMLEGFWSVHTHRNNTDDGTDS